MPHLICVKPRLCRTPSAGNGARRFRRVQGVWLVALGRRTPHSGLGLLGHLEVRPSSMSTSLRASCMWHIARECLLRGTRLAPSERHCSYLKGWAVGLHGYRTEHGGRPSERSSIEAWPVSGECLSRAVCRGSRSKRYDYPCILYGSRPNSEECR